MANDREPDGRALFVRLHDDGPAECLGYVVLQHRRHQPIRGGDAGCAKQPLGQILVHRRGARDVVAPRIGKPREVEDGLRPSVFPRAAVQRNENDIDVANVGSVRGECESRITHVREH